MNSEDLFNTVCSKVSACITRSYSTSFALGIRFLEKEVRPAIHGIYGYVRLADEIVDTFHEYNKKELLEEFIADTKKALDRGISTNPVLQSFLEVVKKYKIEHELIDAFLSSMAMDLNIKNYDHALYQKYIYGSAEVVGLMCLKVFCKGDEILYKKLIVPAKSLGAAFQKVNFLRDMRDDKDERGRVYFPGVNFHKFSEKDKQLIEKDIEHDFMNALNGIRQLPAGSRKGVYLAYRYYRKLFNKIRSYTPEKVLSKRIRISDHIKVLILLKTEVRYRMNLLA